MGMRIPEPGYRASVVYLWLVFLGPLLLLVAGIAILGVGLWRNTESVAALGAVAVIASLVLPRMRGSFELGPGGIKGDQFDIFREVILEARERGLPADEALEIAAGVSTELRMYWTPPERDHVSGLTDVWPEGLRQRPQSRGRDRLAQRIARSTISEAILLDQATEEIVERVAGEKGWTVGRNVRAEQSGGAGAYRIFDFVISTRKGPIIIETTPTLLPESVVERAAAVSDALPENTLAAFVVVPRGSIWGRTRPDVEICPVDDLERRLRALPA